MGRLDGKVAIVSGAARGRARPRHGCSWKKARRSCSATCCDELGERVADELGDEAATCTST